MTKQTNTEVGSLVEGNMSKLANEYNAINLAGNSIEFPVPSLLIDTILDASKNSLGEAPSEGIINLREAISNYISSKFFRVYNPEGEITVTAGSTQAVFTAIAASVKEGDEVIVFEPAYENYATAIQICGARPTFIKLKDGDSPVDWNEVQKAITTRTKLIIICNPHNIGGKVFTSDDMDNLQKLISGTKIRVISDESLSEIIYSDTATSGVAFYPKLSENSFFIGSLGISIGAPGWEIGFCAAPKPLMDPFRKVHRAMVNSVNLPFQQGIAKYISQNKKLFPYSELLEKNRELFTGILSKSKFKLQTISGGYFMILNYSSISSVKDTEFAEMLIHEYGIAVTPMSLFHHDKICRQQVRINIAIDSEVLRKAAEILAGL